MTLTIELKPEIRARLDAEAEAQGIDATELARRLIEEALPAKLTPMSGAEAIAYWEREGLGGVYADREESSKLARKLRQEEESRGRNAA